MEFGSRLRQAGLERMPDPMAGSVDFGELPNRIVLVNGGIWQGMVMSEMSPRIFAKERYQSFVKPRGISGRTQVVNE